MAQRASRCFACGAALSDSPRRRDAFPWSDLLLLAAILAVAALWWTRPLSAFVRRSAPPATPTVALLVAEVPTSTGTPARPATSTPLSLAATVSPAGTISASLQLPPGTAAISATLPAPAGPISGTVPAATAIPPAASTTVTATAAISATATVAPGSSSALSPAPAPLSPPDGSTIWGGECVLLNWTTVTTLGPDDWYAVKLVVQDSNAAVLPQLTKASSWRVPSDLRLSGQTATEFSWQVQVVRRLPDGSTQAVSRASAARRFAWR